MLAVIFELGIYWFTNRDKCSSTANDMFYSDILIRSQWDSIGSAHKNVMEK